MISINTKPELMKIEQIDHIVLTVNNIEATAKFYTEILGMEVIVFGNNRKALYFGNQKINLHKKGQELEPKAYLPTCGRELQFLLP